MTLDKLAEITQHGFTDLGEKLRNEFNPKFDALDRKINNLELKVDEGFQSIGNSIKYLLGELMDMKEIIEKQRHENRIQDLEKRVKQLEESLKK